VRVKAEKDARQELRDERLDTKYNDPATIKQVAKELKRGLSRWWGRSTTTSSGPNDGADRVVNFYQFDMQAHQTWRRRRRFGFRRSPIKKVATR